MVGHILAQGGAIGLSCKEYDIGEADGGKGRCKHGEALERKRKVVTEGLHDVEELVRRQEVRRLSCYLMLSAAGRCDAREAGARHHLTLACPAEKPVGQGDSKHRLRGASEPALRPLCSHTWLSEQRWHAGERARRNLNDHSLVMPGPRIPFAASRPRARRGQLATSATLKRQPPLSPVVASRRSVSTLSFRVMHARSHSQR